MNPHAATGADPTYYLAITSCARCHVGTIPQDQYYNYEYRAIFYHSLCIIDPAEALSYLESALSSHEHEMRAEMLFYKRVYALAHDEEAWRYMEANGQLLSDEDLRYLPFIRVRIDSLHDLLNTQPPVAFLQEDISSAQESSGPILLQNSTRVIPFLLAQLKALGQLRQDLSHLDFEMHFIDGPLPGTKLRWMGSQAELAALFHFLCRYDVVEGAVTKRIWKVVSNHFESKNGTVIKAQNLSNSLYRTDLMDQVQREGSKFQTIEGIARKCRDAAKQRRS